MANKYVFWLSEPNLSYRIYKQTYRSVNHDGVYKAYAVFVLQLLQ